MVSPQPIRIHRGLACACLLGSTLALIPSPRGVQATGVTLSQRILPSAIPFHPRISISAHDRTTRRDQTVLEPPVAANAPSTVRAGLSTDLGATRLHGLGLALSPRDATFMVAPADRSPSISTQTLPSSVDLSTDDPPVGDQGQLDSGTAWATAYTLLGWYANHDADAGVLFDPLSVYAQGAVDQHGNMTFDEAFRIEQRGVPLQTQGPQDRGLDGMQPRLIPPAAPTYHLTGYEPIYTSGVGSAQQAIETAMAAGRPVALGIPVYSNFMGATASAPLVGVPPSRAPFFGSQAVVGVKYDSAGLWVQNQWGTGWGLHGYAELTWRFVNRYAYDAYTIDGVRAPDSAVQTLAAPGVDGPPAAQPASYQAPALGAAVTVAPSSGAPGTLLFITGSGFGSGVVAVFSNGTEIAAMYSTGSFMLSAVVSTTAAPGPRTIRAVNLSTGAQASTIFTVTGSAATATTAPTKTADSPTPTTTPTRVPPTPTQAPPTATQPPATPTTPPTVTGASLKLSPSTAGPGTVVAATGSGYRPGETVTVTVNGMPLVMLIASPQGTIAFNIMVSQSTSPGTYTLHASGSSGDQASATLTVNSGGGATATPTSPASTVTSVPSTPTAVATQPAATATPASGNGCSITTASSQAEAQLLSLLNQDRASAGVAPLQLNSALSSVARAHSCDMFQHQQLSHFGSDGSSPPQRMAAGGFTIPPYQQEGENIGDASGFSPPDAVSAINSSMMAEPATPGTHHWNIINSGYSIVGVGIVVANGQTWLTEDFAG